MLPASHGIVVLGSWHRQHVVPGVHHGLSIRHAESVMGGLARQLAQHVAAAAG